MIVLYFVGGLLASFLGALPLGASNIAVINTTIKQNATQAFKIAVAAGLAEVILSYYALHCNVIVKHFIDMNAWLQIVILFILIAVGLLLLLKKQNPSSKDKKPLLQSKYLLGFFLGLLNPPVLVYWILIFGFINRHDYKLSLQSPFIILLLFFVGVYLGKVLTLYAYGKFSTALKHRITNINQRISFITGALLIAIALVQVVKLFVV